MLNYSFKVNIFFCQWLPFTSHVAASMLLLGKTAEMQTNHLQTRRIEGRRTGGERENENLSRLENKSFYDPVSKE